MKTINTAIIDYLKKNRVWAYGGTLETIIGRETRTKNSVIAVRLRNLSEHEWSPLEKRKVENPKGRGPKVMIYKIRTKKLIYV